MNIYFVPQQWQMELYGNPSKYIQEQLTEEQWYDMVMFELYAPDDFSFLKSTRCPEYGTEEFKQLMMDKYGVEHNRYIERMVDRMEESRIKTMKEKYGVVSPAQIPEIMDKILKNRDRTMTDRYGVKNSMLVPEIKRANREANAKTVKEKYGVENVFQLQDVKSKIKETNLQKYGCSHHAQREEERKKLSERAKRVIEEKKNRPIVKTLYLYVKKYKAKLGKNWWRKNEQDLSIILLNLKNEYGELNEQHYPI